MRTDQIIKARDIKFHFNQTLSRAFEEIEYILNRDNVRDNVQDMEFEILDQKIGMEDELKVIKEQLIEKNKKMTSDLKEKVSKFKDLYDEMSEMKDKIDKTEKLLTSIKSKRDEA